MSDFNPPGGGYGRIWEQMYEGSLAGSGPEVFCLMPYIIAKMRMTKDIGATVILNPDVLAPIFGVRDRGFIERGIAKLEAPDKATKNGSEHEGRRIIKVSGHLYLVVNGENYMKIRANERHAEAQARYRAKIRKGAESGQTGKTLEQGMEDARPRRRKSAGQVRAESEAREKRFVEAGSEEERDRIVAEGLPGASEPTKVGDAPESEVWLNRFADEAPEGAEYPPRQAEEPMEENEEPPFEP